MSSAVSIDDAQRLAWYRVDPRTGQAVGVLDSGFHGAQAEYILAHIRVALAYPPLVMRFWTTFYLVQNATLFLAFAIMLPLWAGYLAGSGIMWTVDRAGRFIRK